MACRDIVAAELRLVEAVKVSTECISRTRQSGVHGALQPGSDHDNVRTASGNEEVGTGRKGIQGMVIAGRVLVSHYRCKYYKNVYDFV